MNSFLQFVLAPRNFRKRKELPEEGYPYSFRLCWSLEEATKIIPIGLNAFLYMPDKRTRAVGGFTVTALANVFGDLRIFADGCLNYLAWYLSRFLFARSRKVRAAPVEAVTKSAAATWDSSPVLGDSVSAGITVLFLVISLVRASSE